MAITQKDFPQTRKGSDTQISVARQVKTCLALAKFLGDNIENVPVLVAQQDSYLPLSDPSWNGVSNPDSQSHSLVVIASGFPCSWPPFESLSQCRSSLLN